MQINEITKKRGLTMLRALHKPLKFSDLKALDSSPDKVRAAFKKECGVEPDGIALNDETYFSGATQPPITETYGVSCDKILGEIEFSDETDVPDSSAVVGTAWAYNHDTDPKAPPIKVNGSVAYSFDDTVGWSSSVTKGLEFSGELEVKGVFKFGMKFNISETIGKSSSSSKSTSSTTGYSDVSVPSAHKRKIDVIATEQKGTMKYKAPINVIGHFGANFPKKVNGHYFWFCPADNLLPKTSGEVEGEISGTRYINVEIHVYPPVPIDAPED